MVSPVTKTIPIKHCNFEAKVKTAGSGPPLVYLHPAGGPLWDDFVDGLAEHYTVYAPHHPGTGETVRESLYSVESLWDLVLSTTKFSTRSICSQSPWSGPHSAA